MSVFIIFAPSKELNRMKKELKYCTPAKDARPEREAAFFYSLHIGGLIHADSPKAGVFYLFKHN